MYLELGQDWQKMMYTRAENMPQLQFLHLQLEVQHMHHDLYRQTVGYLLFMNKLLVLNIEIYKRALP